MGIWDIFTGDPAKKAAEENKRLLQENLATGTKELKEGRAGALDALSTASGAYNPLIEKYGAASNLALDALGVNGAAGNDRAAAAYRPSLGYTWQVDQATDAAARKAAALGIAGSGNTLDEIRNRAQNVADTDYGSWLDRLQGYVQPELAATGGQAGYTAAKAPIYTGTASNLANLGTTTTNGVTSQNTQAANAEMQGSGNLWGLGLNLAKLGVSAATGGLGGGTSLLGGGGGGTAGVMNYGGQSWPSFG